MADFIVIYDTNNDLLEVRRIETNPLIQKVRDAKTVYDIIRAIQTKSISGIVTAPVDRLMVAGAIDVSRRLTPDQKASYLATIRRWRPGDSITTYSTAQLPAVSDIANSAAAREQYAKLIKPYKDP